MTSTEMPGNYRIQAGGGEEAVDLGFSVNLPAEISRLDRIDGEQLKTLFGDTPFRLAHDREEIDRNVSAGRVGHELFPLLDRADRDHFGLRAGVVESVLSPRRAAGAAAARIADGRQLGRRRKPSGRPRRSKHHEPVVFQSGWRLPSGRRDWRWLLVLLLTFLGLPRHRLTPRRRQVLLGLRLAVIALAVMAMLRPALVITKTRQRVPRSCCWPIARAA